MDPTEPLTEERRDPSGDPSPGGRRQGALAAAGALVVAAFLVAITLPRRSDAPGRDAGPDRPTVSPTPPPPSNYIRRSSVELVATRAPASATSASAEDGTIAAVWESRDGEDQALAIDRPDGSAYVADPGQLLVSVVTAPGGLLVHRADYYKVGVLRTSGAMDPVTLTDVPAGPGARRRGRRPRRRAADLPGGRRDRLRPARRSTAPAPGPATSRRTARWWCRRCPACSRATATPSWRPAPGAAPPASGSPTTRAPPGARSPPGRSPPVPSPRPRWPATAPCCSPT